MSEPYAVAESRGSGFMMGLLCGAAVGAALGLMYAPKSGTELRRTLTGSADQFRKKASKAYDQVSDAVSKGRETFDDAREEARH